MLHGLNGYNGDIQVDADDVLRLLDLLAEFLLFDGDRDCYLLPLISPHNNYKLEGGGLKRSHIRTHRTKTDYDPDALVVPLA